MGKVERQSTPARKLLTVLAMVALAVVSGGAVAAADQGDTIRVSVDSTGVEGDNRSRDSVITDDGRQVVFRSIASNLVPGDNTLDTGIASNEFFFGDPGDRFVSGDWGIVDGTDTPDCSDRGTPPSTSATPTAKATPTASSYSANPAGYPSPESSG